MVTVSFFGARISGSNGAMKVLYEHHHDQHDADTKPEAS